MGQDTTELLTRPLLQADGFVFWGDGVLLHRYNIQSFEHRSVRTHLKSIRAIASDGAGLLAVGGEDKQVALVTTTGLEVKRCIHLRKPVAGLAARRRKDASLDLAVADRFGEIFLFAPPLDSEGFPRRETPEEAVASGATVREEGDDEDAEEADDLDGAAAPPWLTHLAQITAFGVSEVGDGRIASGDKDGKVLVTQVPRVYDIEAALLGHHEVVTMVTFLSARPELIVSGAADGSLILWAREGGKRLSLSKVDGVPISACLLRRNGQDNLLVARSGMPGFVEGPLTPEGIWQPSGVLSTKDLVVCGAASCNKDADVLWIDDVGRLHHATFPEEGLSDHQLTPAANDAQYQPVAIDKVSFKDAATDEKRRVKRQLGASANNPFFHL